jgi:hypothetical protein
VRRPTKKPVHHAHEPAGTHGADGSVTSEASTRSLRTQQRASTDPAPRPSFPPPEGGCTKRATASRRPTGQCSTP